MIAGLVIGLFVGATVLKGGGGGSTATPTYAAQAKGAKGDAYKEAFAKVQAQQLWTPLPIKWKRLKPYSEAGVAPLTFQTPALAYDYGGVSYPLPSALFKDDQILRVDVTDVKGVVGVSLVNPNGDPLVSQEQGLVTADGKRSIFFLVRGKDLPAGILLRNYGDTSGATGSIKVEQVMYAPAASLSDDQMDAVQTIGLNKSLTP